LLGFKINYENNWGFGVLGFWGFGVLWVSGINLGSIYLSKKEIQINNVPNGWVTCMA